MSVPIPLIFFNNQEYVERLYLDPIEKETNLINARLDELNKKHGEFTHEQDQLNQRLRELDWLAFCCPHCGKHDSEGCTNWCSTHSMSKTNRKATKKRQKNIDRHDSRNSSTPTIGDYIVSNVSKKKKKKN
jgi:hypothetical protein